MCLFTGFFEQISSVESLTPWTKTETPWTKPKTPCTKTKTLWTKTKAPVDQTLTAIQECCGISSGLFNCDNKVYHSPFLRSTACSSVLKCRTIISINTFTKQNNRRREEITTRHLTLMNSRRGEPRALFIIFTSSIKKGVDPEHHSSEGVHFGFHVSKVQLYICRVQERMIYFILTSIVQK